MNQSQAFRVIVQERHSCRAYDQDRPVPEEALQNCLEAARLAPSACNKQPWRFIVVDDPAILAEIFHKGLMPGIDHSWWETAPVLVILGVEKDMLTHRIAPAFSKIPYHLIDAGIAGEHFVLAAAAQGLGTCWIGWFKPKAVQKTVEIPRNVDVIALLTLGYPAKEPETRTPRKELNEIAYRNQWGQAFQRI